MPTDPLTGIPSDWIPLTQYQIPLGTNPVLAPEWRPQGRISNPLYPDNMPSVFATAQAQNNTNPSVVQALTTDGKGNLNVNMAAGGGGGGVAQCQAFAELNAEALATGGSVQTAMNPPLTVVWSYTVILWLHGSPPTGGIRQLWIQFQDNPLTGITGIPFPTVMGGAVTSTERPALLYTVSIPGGFNAVPSAQASGPLSVLKITNETGVAVTFDVGVFYT